MAAAKPTTMDEIIKRVDELPTLPTIVYELNQVINDPLAAAADVEKIMINDQSLTARVLKLVNSAYYAIPGGVSNLTRAIAYLGFDVVQQLVLTASVLDTTAGDGPENGLNMKQFWLHSMGVAIAAETIGKHLQHKSPADLFTAGLLHDLGKVALQMINPELMAEIVKHAVSTGMTIDEAEAAFKNVKHTTLGKLLTEKWRLPRKIQVAAQFHHELDPAARQGVSVELHEIVDIVALANMMIHALKFGSSGHQKVLGFSKSMLVRLNLPADQMKDLVEKIKKGLASADGILRIVGGQ